LILRCFAAVLNFFGGFGVSQLIGIEVGDMHADAVFYFTLTERMQVRLPMRIMLEVFGNVPR